MCLAALEIVSQSFPALDQVDSALPEYFNAERFRYIGIGPYAESFQIIFLTTFGCEQDNGNVVDINVLFHF